MSTKESRDILLNEFEKLDEEGQKKIINYVKWLAHNRSNKNLNKFLTLAGSIDTEELKLMDEAIEKGC